MYFKKNKFFTFLISSIFLIHTSTVNGQQILDKVCLSEQDSEIFHFNILNNKNVFSVKCTNFNETTRFYYSNENENMVFTTCIALLDNNEEKASVIFLYDIVFINKIIKDNESEKIETKKRICYLNSINIREDLFELKKGDPA